MFGFLILRTSMTEFLSHFSTLTVSLTWLGLTDIFLESLEGEGGLGDQRATGEMELL